jgi:Tfp pilus assembly protein PilP
LHYAMAISLLVSAAACGEDDPPPPPPKGGASKTGPGAKPAGKPPPQFAVRVRIEDRVLEPEEKKGIRHTFKDRDFVAEQNNRDPFQSFVLNQGVLNSTDTGTPRVVTPKCQRPEQLVATNYSYTDLRLVGIVAQGTQRKVLMMDAGNLGHIIKRGDCVGREKAVVKDIGTGYITFQIEPDETASGQARTGEERSIQLYPNQMPITSQPVLDNEAAKGQTPDVAPPPSAPPPSRPAPQK